MSISELGVDCGSARTRISARGRVAFDEPSVVALRRKTRQVLCVGEEARRMLGRNPDSIEVCRPIEDGVIADIAPAESMAVGMIRRVMRGVIVRPHIVLGIPPGLTKVEAKAYHDLAASAGARKIRLISSPMAAALGAGIDVDRAKGIFVLDIGAGTADVAVLSLSGIVAQSSVRAAGRAIDRRIIAHIRSEHSVLIGDATAEQIKHEIATIEDDAPLQVFAAKGKNIYTRMPETVGLTNRELVPVVREAVEPIVQEMTRVLERTPPELVADIGESEAVVVGGSSALPGLVGYLSKRIGLALQTADDPERCVVKGCGKSFGCRDDVFYHPKSTE